MGVRRQLGIAGVSGRGCFEMERNGGIVGNVNVWILGMGESSGGTAMRPNEGPFRRFSMRGVVTGR
jgi:hypothetical protein